MAGEAVIEGGGVHGVEHGGGGRHHIAVEHDRHLLVACRDDGAGNGGDLPPAQTAQHFQRIGEMLPVKGDGIAHSGDLARQNFACGAGAGPDPFLRRAAIEAVADGGGDRGVADAHLAEAQEVRAAGDGFHAEGHGGGAGLLVERGVAGDVRGRIVEGEVEHPQTRVEGGADLVHRRLAGREGRHHLLRHGAGIGRDAAVGDAVGRGEHRHHGAVDGGHRIALPGGQVGGDGFETPQRARRLHQLLLPGQCRLARALVGAGEGGDELADVVEGRACLLREHRAE